MRRTFTLFALVIALALTTQAMAREWLRAETPNFIVYSDGYPIELERWARKVEMFDALLRQQFDEPSGRKGSRLVIYMLADEKAVARLAGQQYLTGLYRRDRDGSFAVTNRRPGYYRSTLSGQATLFHEYAHHFMYRHFPAAYPAWYREGFAEYAATAQYDVAGTWQFGAPASYRMKFLRRDHIPLEQILFADPEALPAKRRAAYYSWAWLLVHKLRTDPTRAGQLDRYLARFAAGANLQEAARAFGDLGRLQAELDTYRNQVMRYRPPEVSVAYNDAVTVETLDPLQSRLVDLSLARRLEGDLQATRAQLRDLASAHPESADVQLELALVERDIARKEPAHDFTLAQAAADRARALAPNNAHANTLNADLTIRQLAENGDKSSGDWVAARKRLVAAMRTAPEDPLPALVFYESFVRQGTIPPALAHAAIEKAFALQPESIQVRTSYVLSLALRGRLDEAEAHARVLAYDPHANELGERALDLIARVREAKAQAGGGSR